MKKNRQDVFHAWLVEGADFAGKWDIPAIPATCAVPSSLVSFNDVFPMTKQPVGNWVHFYIDDYKFERIWNNPDAYLEGLKNYGGVISPDFSLYRDMPLVMQAWNTYRSRAIGYWLSKNGIRVIPNVRWSDGRSYEFCFDGVPADGVVSIGTHGCVKRNEDKNHFLLGFREMLSRLSPKVLVVYGRLPKELFKACEKAGTTLRQFDSAFSESHRKEGE
jgi:hypothetical protein